MYTRMDPESVFPPPVLNPLFSRHVAAILRFYISYASYTLVIYDYVCTFDTEVHYVWSCSWTKGLLLFYLNRYLPFIEIILISRRVISPTISQMECRWGFPLTTWLQTVGVMTSEVIIILRTYAIWGCWRPIYWILTPIAVLTIALVLGLTGWNTFVDYDRLTSMMKKFGPLPSNIKCQISVFPTDSSSSITLMIICLVIFTSEAAVFILTAVKAKQHINKATHQWVNQLYNNGILYCACLLALTLANSIVVFVADPEFKYFLLALQRCLHSIFCNRIIFLILENRKLRISELRSATGGVNQSNYHHAISTRDILTSVYLDTLPTSYGNTEEDGGYTTVPWRARADQEWIY